VPYSRRSLARSRTKLLPDGSWPKSRPDVLVTLTTVASEDGSLRSVEINTLRDDERPTGSATGTARPFPLWRLPSGPYSPPVDPIYSGVVCPQARIGGHLTLQPLVRFRTHCGFVLGRPAVWPHCYIPPGKSRACFDDFKMHSIAQRVDRSRR
jgi:hypothetical protein